MTGNFLVNLATVRSREGLGCKAWMSYFIKSDLSVKNVDGVVSGILTLFVEALVFEDVRASVRHDSQNGWSGDSEWAVTSYYGYVQQQRVWSGPPGTVSVRNISSSFVNWNRSIFKCKINRVKKIIMNSYLKSKRSDVCENVLIYRIILNWNMTTGRSFTAIQWAACANTYPEVECRYGSTTSS